MLSILEDRIQLTQKPETGELNPPAKELKTYKINV